MPVTLADEVRLMAGLPAPPARAAIRRRARVTHERLAAELGVHRLTVIRWENGTREPRGDRRLRYARLLAELREAVALAQPAAVEARRPDSVMDRPGGAAA